MHSKDWRLQCHSDDKFSQKVQYNSAEACYWQKLQIGHTWMQVTVG